MSSTQPQTAPGGAATATLDPGGTPPTATPQGRRFNFGRLLSGTEAQLIVGLLVLFAVFAIQYPDSFGTSANVEDMTRVGAILLVVAIGQSFALVVGGFDISVGANMGFVSTVVGLRLADGASVPEATLVALLAGSAVGLANGLLIAWAKVTPFIATLGMLTVLGGLANQLSDGASVSGFPAAFRQLGGADWGPIPSTVGIAAIVLVLAWLLLSRFRAGLYLYAIGGSRETARVSGVPVLRYELLAYVLCGFCAAVAGIMLASRVSVGQASLGQGYELLSIATAVMGGFAIGGGVGRLRGVILGVALLTVLRTGLNIGGVNQFVQQMITGAVLVGAVMLAGASRLRLIRLPQLFSSKKIPTKTERERTKDGEDEETQ